MNECERLLNHRSAALKFMRFSAFTFATAICFSLSAFAVDQGLLPATDPTAIDLTPTKTTATPVIESGPIVREGTRFVSRTGRLNRSVDGQRMVFTFDDGTNAGPMTVLANLNLFSMESVLSAKGTGVQFRVSGTVAEYKGHNYILLDKVQTTLASPTTMPLVAVAPSPRPVVKLRETTTQIAETKPTTAALPGASSPEETMTRLLAPAPPAGQPLPPPISNDFPTTDRSTGIAAIAPAAADIAVIREGTHLINRVARLSHSSDGRQGILTFDSDGTTMKDPPMVILPNSKLETMENDIVNLSTDLHFRVSGTITEYKGRNYIQLDKAVYLSDIEKQF